MSFHQVYTLIRQITNISQNYYPESLAKMFIINSPFLFNSVWNMIKPLLDEVTVHKIYVLSSNYEKKLLEFIDEENLPAALGGKCSCQGTCEKSDSGPWHEKY
jgi:hypothetical protein